MGIAVKILCKRTDQLSAVYGNFRNTVHVFLEHNLALQSRGRIIKMDDYVFRTPDCIKGFSD